MTVQQQEHPLSLRTPGDALLSLLRDAWQRRLLILCAVVVSASASDDELSRLTRRLIAELTAAERSREAAYRGGCRWIRSYSSSIPSEGASPPTRLRRGGVYLLTGGMGRIGLALAERLASTVEDVRLILVGRTEFPARSQWSERLAHPDIGEIGRKIALLQSLENRGAQILVATADVANIEQMEQVFTLAQRRFGAVDGVIHCAGRLHGAAKPIQALCKQDFEDQYRSKVHGTLVLERLPQARERQHGSALHRDRFSGRDERARLTGVNHLVKSVAALAA